MTINYKFGEGQVVEKEKEYIDQRLGKIIKLLPDYSQDDEVLCDIEISQDKKSFWRVEVGLQTPHNLYRAEETSHNLTEAYDRVEDMLKKQIRRSKERMMDLRERGGRSIKKKTSIDTNARF